MPWYPRPTRLGQGQNQGYAVHRHRGAVARLAQVRPVWSTVHAHQTLPQMLVCPLQYVLDTYARRQRVMHHPRCPGHEVPAPAYPGLLSLRRPVWRQMHELLEEHVRRPLSSRRLMLYGCPPPSHPRGGLPSRRLRCRREGTSQRGKVRRTGGDPVEDSDTLDTIEALITRQRSLPYLRLIIQALVITQKTLITSLIYNEINGNRNDNNKNDIDK